MRGAIRCPVLSVRRALRFRRVAHARHPDDACVVDVATGEWGDEEVIVGAASLPARVGVTQFLIVQTTGSPRRRAERRPASGQTLAARPGLR